MVGASRAPPTEAAVKADFLARFVRYVGWPTAAAPGPGSPFQLCVVGRDPFGRLLDRAAARQSIDGHAIAVRRVPSIEWAAGCNVAFVQAATPGETGRQLFGLRFQPVLTVTDASAGPQRGMIHFAVIGGRVRFFIDEAAAAERGLAISSRLLALAAGVRQRR
jgi:hypothetical protein